MQSLIAHFGFWRTILGLTTRPKWATGLDMRLSEYLSREGMGEAAFAARIGMSAKAVQHWIQGDRTPRPEQMQKILTSTGGAVTPNDFFASQQVPNEAAE